MDGPDDPAWRRLVSRREYTSTASQVIQLKVCGLLSILAYSIDSPTSFAALSGLLRTVQSVKNPLLAPFAVVATKCDLATTSRQVPAATGLAFAREHGGLFNETSAKLGVNVDQAFESLLKAVIAERERSFSRGTAGKRGKSAPSSPAHSRSGSKTLQDVSSGFDDDKENEGKTKKGKKSLQMDRRASRSIGGLGRDPQRYESDGHAGGCKCLIM